MKYESSTLNVHQFGHPDNYLCVVTCDKGDPFNNMGGISEHLEERTLNHIIFDFFTFTSIMTMVITMDRYPFLSTASQKY